MQYGPTVVSDTSVQTPKINQISFILGPLGSKQIDCFFDFHGFSLIFIEALKIAENHENQGFTFFAFLPPYFDVSGFLAYPKGKNFSSSID